MPRITKEIRKFIKQGMEWSIKKQSELFNQNFVTRYLYRKAVSKWNSSSY